MCAQDNEAVLELLVQRGEWRRALAVLRQPHISPELVYKFAPGLMASLPAETVRRLAPPTWLALWTACRSICPACSSQNPLELVNKFALGMMAGWPAG